jgi:hypothetical protein
VSSTCGIACRRVVVRVVIVAKVGGFALLWQAVDLEF